MARSTLFQSNRSQAVRLPKSVVFPADVRQVEVIKLGHSRLIAPAGRLWDQFFLDGPAVSEDFARGADQAAEEREPL